MFADRLDGVIDEPVIHLIQPPRPPEVHRCEFRRMRHFQLVMESDGAEEEFDEQEFLRTFPIPCLESVVHALVDTVHDRPVDFGEEPPADA